MIYISVDNDHHGGLALSLIKKHGVAAEEVMFISHISQRNNTIPASNYQRQIVPGHPLSSGSGYKNPLSYIRSFFHQQTLNRTFSFRPEDTLLIITEYQINNALLARSMKSSGGQVFLFDEGIGFYFNNSPLHDTRLTVLDRFYLRLYNLAFWALGIPAYAKKGFEGRMYVRVSDVLIDCIYSRMRLPIDRPGRIQGYRNFLASEQATQRKNDNLTIFFANNLSGFSLKHEEFEVSGAALDRLAISFETVYLKIHPADWVEKNDVYDFYMRLIKEHKNIVLVDNALTGNEAIEKFRPRVVVGTMGATMFDAFFFDCQPVFLFHFLPPIREFDICRFTLDSIGYRYVQNIEEIGPNYNCEVDISALIYEEEGLQLHRYGASVDITGIYKPPAD